MSSEAYRFRDTLQYLDAGVFEQKLDLAFKDICAAVAYHGEKGKRGRVTVELTVERIGETLQVNCSHALKTLKPTAKGKVTEENTTNTLLHVTRSGPTFVRSDQLDAFGQEISDE